MNIFLNEYIFLYLCIFNFNMQHIFRYKIQYLELLTILIRYFTLNYYKCIIFIIEHLFNIF